MGWGECVMDAKREFVRLASVDGANVRELCRRFHVSPTTGYALLARAESSDGEEWLQERSRRPLTSPTRTEAEMEKRVLELRDETHWGARKIAYVLRKRGYKNAPPRSTVHSILRRHGRVDGEQPGQTHQWHRFEHPEPNDLWQMDFKGDFAIGRGRCHPLTVLDDHSRYALGLAACGNEQDGTVRQKLVEIFRRYGLPMAMLMDNGSPWGDSGGERHTTFSVWLLRLGVKVIHGRPYHPQTQGKDERFHRSLKAEVLSTKSFADLTHCQHAFDRWRPIYNNERPHDALDLAVPAERYRMSERSYPEVLPAIDYAPGDSVRSVDLNGRISFQGWIWRVGKAFRGELIALRPTITDGVFSLHYCTHQVGTIDLNSEPAPAQDSEHLITFSTSYPQPTTTAEE